VSYWVASSGGLARAEIKVSTSSDATSLGSGAPSNVDEAKCVLAPEVRSLQFSYFDGTNWQDSWDSTALGPDGVTPQGSPRAIAIVLGIVRPHRPGKPEEVKTYRQVVPILTANGATQQNNTTQPTGGGTTP
jgi:hypothetical protein